jgi:hypothetical protein
LALEEEIEADEENRQRSMGGASNLIKKLTPSQFLSAGMQIEDAQ